LAAELLETASAAAVEIDAQSSAKLSSGQAEELTRLREQYSSLLEEATYHKNHAQQLERENRRLADQHKYSRKSKKQLAAKVVALEAEIQKERRERAAMEEALTEAYSTALREMVALQESTAVARAAPTGGRRIKGGNFR